MKFLLYSSLVLLVVMGWLIYMARKYRNPYLLYMIVAKKGGGKTTLIAKKTQQYRAKGRPVYSTVAVPGAYLIDPEDVGRVHFPPESVIFMDEVGMFYDNRDWKSGNMTKEVRNYFKLQRHYKHTVYLFSQAWDIDVKLRNLTDQMYLLQCFWGFLSIGKQVKRKIVVVNPTADAESRIADQLIVSPLISTPFGGRIFTYIPHWIALFDSYDAPKLPEKEFEYIDYPDGLRIDKHGRVRQVKDKPNNIYNNILNKLHPKEDVERLDDGNT